MKKSILIALIILLYAGSGMAANDNKKGKKKVVGQPVATTPVTERDSLSYAAGMRTTNGLVSYLQSQYKVNMAFSADFMDGLKEALASDNDPRYNARRAGTIIAHMLKENIMPQAKNEFAETNDSINTNMFYQGFFAGVLNDTTVYSVNEADKIFQRKREEEKKAKNRAYDNENRAWLNANARKEGVKMTNSGLQYKIIKTGTGAIPKEDDRVTVKYEGKLIDGTVFDSSYKREPQTTSFRCNQVIKGWTEALLMMPAGSKWEVYIPEKLGYGERQAGQIKPFSTLIFTIELVSVSKEEKVEETTK